MIQRCIYCLSPKVVRNGHTGEGIQRYKCNGCGKRFSEKGFFARLRHNVKDVLDAVWLRIHRQSLREAARSMAKIKKIKISHTTVLNWVKKLFKLLVWLAKLVRLSYSLIWHVDEKYIKVRGCKDWAYLFVVIDSNSNVIAVYVSKYRSIKAAKEVLRKAKDEAGTAPDVVITDGLQAYKKACKILGRKVKHLTKEKRKKNKKFFFYKGKFLKLSNNRIERVNSDIDLFVHVFRGFKSFENANMWTELFRIWHNYLRPRCNKGNIELHKLPVVVGNLREKQELPVFMVIVITF